MSKPIISAIAIMGARTHAIGNDNKLIWDIPDDLKRVKEITRGHPLIMGRKTHEAIGRPLPGRANIVVTRQKDYTSPGTIVVHSVEEALEEAKKHDDEEIFIFGGQQIYEQTLPHAQRLYLALVDSDAEGDSFFPDYSEFSKETYRENREHNGLKYSWINLERE